MTAVDRLDKIEARANGATPSPWVADTGIRGDCVIWGPDGSFLSNAQAEPHWVPAADGSTRQVQFDVDRHDVEFIAAARTDIPALVAALRAILALTANVGNESTGPEFVACYEVRDAITAALDATS